MKPVVFLIFLIGVGTMIQRTVDFSSEESSFSAIAVNYAMFMKTMGFLETYRLLYLISLRAGAPCVIGVRAWMRVDATFTVMHRCKKSWLCVSSSGEVLLWEWPAMAALSL